MAKIKKTTFYIKGMHCPSCEILIEDKFKEEKNIKNIKADFKSQQVVVEYSGKINLSNLDKKIHPFGYQIITEKNEKVKKGEDESLGRRVFEALAIAAIILIVSLIAKELNLFPSFNFTGNLSLLTIFVIGLVASTSTCMATAGVLFLSLVKPITLRQPQGDREVNQTQVDTDVMMSLTNYDNLSKAIFFNTGRIISYGLFGFLAGLVGQALIVNFKLGSFLTLLVAIFMLFLGLNLVKIINIATLIPSRLNKIIFENLEHKLKKYPRKAPFFLGAITYFLPCGFTQAVQIYALGQASPVQSALTMIVFAAGTAPALFLVGSVASLTKTSLYHYFMKVMGVLVFLIGILYISNFLSLYGVNLINWSNKVNGASVRVVNGVQIIEMRVVSSGYEPNFFKVKKGIPVKWKIEGVNVFGCQAYLVVPKLGIQKIIQEGWQTIEFTPDETGLINFSCGMGMYRGRIEVIN